MQKVKKSIVVGASVLAMGAGGLGIAGVASADTTSTNTPDSSIVSKIATKFGLDKAKVQAVFDEDRAAHQADMKQHRADALKTAVSDGKLTQAQADHITAAWAEIDALHQASGGPGSETAAQRTELKTKMDALRTWAKDQNLDLRTILGMPNGMHGGPHGMGMHDTDDDSTNSSSSTTTK